VLDNDGGYDYIESMTITQTVEITDDYRVTLEIPRSVPKGKTNITIQFPVVENPKADSEIPQFTEKEFEELMKNCPHTQALSGILSSLGDVDLDEWRMKRLAKHL
jgi:hypothetical protein